MQEVNLDKHVKLLDSPGVVMDTDQSPVAAVLRNVVRVRGYFFLRVLLTQRTEHATIAWHDCAIQEYIIIIM